MSRILVVAAHPDDEVLGCGGTIARHVDSGDQVQVLIVAEGSTSVRSNGIELKLQTNSQPLFKLRKLLDQSLGQLASNFFTFQIIAWILLIAWISSNVSRNA